jgi:O-6-methylguanine DNA methyltransferase
VLDDVLCALAVLAQGGGATYDLPVDLRGTTFQARVWSALRLIPPGQTRSYRQVAEAVGAPAAVRAVAGACATNRVALVVPCHRVVRSNGELGGFRWGLAVKQTLLDAEHAATAAQWALPAGAVAPEDTAGALVEVARWPPERPRPGRGRRSPPAVGRGCRAS